MRRFKSLCSFYLCLIIPILFMFPGYNCQKNDTSTRTETVKGLLDNLRTRTECIVLGSEGGASLLISPALGARVMGLSTDGINGKNLIWINSEILSDEFWKDGPGWNAGGYRSWIAPEDAFYLDENDEWFVPKAMDPGSYKLVNSTATMATLVNDFTVISGAGDRYDCKLTREIHIIENEQQDITGVLPEAVGYAGIRVVHSLENTGEKVYGKDYPYIGLWSLLMVEPSGTMIIPLAKPGGKDEAYRDYFNPLPPERISVHPKAITVKIDGKYRSKIGIAPEYAGTGIAFLAQDEDSYGRLYIKQFMVDPDGIYLDHPWGEPSDYGDVIEMYNDDGNMGGFAELECHGPSRVLGPGEKEVHDVLLHVFTGPAAELRNICSKILKLNLDDLTFYN